MSASVTISSSQDYIESLLANSADGAAQSSVLRYAFEQYYLPGKPVIELLALVLVADNKLSAAVIVPCSEALENQLQQAEVQCAEDLTALAHKLQLPCFDFSQALPLETVSISKPWGREIWYTGIEERGQAKIGDGSFFIPLPWLLSLSHPLLCNSRSKEVNLLKILDPLPEEVFGDLYFELHEEKQEVYVVTHIDPQAWPSGEGGIRFGFDPLVRSEYKDDLSFKLAFKNAVAAYELVRRQIDQILDQRRLSEGVALDAPLSADVLKLWLEGIPADLVVAELKLREAMNHFKAIKPLKLADVVKVPCFTPHSLQHGVRTIEFQTPVYERQIVSFAQKVLTQSHWDTASAIDCMSLDTPEDEPLAIVIEGQGLRVEEVVSFDDFQVVRVNLQPMASYNVESAGQYCLAIAVSGSVSLAGCDLSAEQAAFVPASFDSAVIINNSSAEAVVLVSYPR